MMASYKTLRSYLLGICGALLLGGGAFACFLNRNELSDLLTTPSDQPGAPVPLEPLVELALGKPSTVRLTSAISVQLLGLEFANARPAPPPQPLRLPGSLFLDPNRLIHVHSRFGGEAVAIAEITDSTGQQRPLQYGDAVRKGQVLAVIWSKEIGEKKSEFVDAVSRLQASQNLLNRLESLKKGVVAERSLLEARRAVEADTIAVARAERTLRSWRTSDEEIEAVRQELRGIQTQAQAGGDLAQRRKVADRWAEIEVKAAIDGIIMEKNFNVGDIIEPEDDLFKIADLSRMLVLANVYEEDLWAVRHLEGEDRRWSIDLKSDPSDNRIEGEFELIGSVIDPAQRTGVIMGWIDNRDGKLAVGQFITATIELPKSPSVVEIPESALIEEGDSTCVFVETDAARQEFVRRKVNVVRRASGMVYIDGRPSNSESIQPGERVIAAGSLGLGGELENLMAASKDRDNQ